MFVCFPYSLSHCFFFLPQNFSFDNLKRKNKYIKGNSLFLCEDDFNPLLHAAGAGCNNRKKAMKIPAKSHDNTSQRLELRVGPPGTGLSLERALPQKLSLHRKFLLNKLYFGGRGFVSYHKALKCLSICPPAIFKVVINQQLSFIDALRSKAP